MPQLSGLACPLAYGAVVLGCLVLKNFQRARPSGPPWLLRARWGAEQMVCKQNSFGSGGEGDLSKGAGTQPRHRERGSGSSISPGQAGVWPWAGRLCGSWGCWCPCKAPGDCTVRALIPNHALESWLGSCLFPLPRIPVLTHKGCARTPECGITLQRSVLSSLGNG